MCHISHITAYGTSKVIMFGATNHGSTCNERYALRDPQPHIHRHRMPGYGSSKGDDELQLRGQHDLRMRVTVAGTKLDAASRGEYSTPAAARKLPKTENCSSRSTSYNSSCGDGIITS